MDKENTPSSMSFVSGLVDPVSGSPIMGGGSGHFDPTGKYTTSRSWETKTKTKKEKEKLQMKKFYKTLTLCLALVMLLGIMAVPASAAWDYMYVVWTEDEFWDLSNPRPVPPANTHIYMFVVTKGDDFDFEKGWYDDTYRGQLSNIIPTYTDISSMRGNAAVQKSAREAYDRNTDAEWKKLIADTFGLKVDSGNTTPEPETPTKPETPVTPEKPVTPPTTTTPPATTTKPVTSFTDVKPGAWYYDAVMALANSGIIAGYGDGRFGPNDTITVGELATIMCRIYGLDTSTPINRPSIKHGGHDDSTVNTGHWAETAINRMYFSEHLGFRMCIANMKLNRGWAIGQLAISLEKATWPDGTKLSVPGSAGLDSVLDTIPDVARDFAGGTYYGKYTEDKSHYPDYQLRQLPDIPDATTGEEVVAHNYVMGNKKGNSYSYANDLSAWDPYSVATAYHIGLVSGVDSTGRCDPWAPITRAQVVQMLYNMGITQAGQLKTVEPASKPSNGVIIGMF